MQMVMSIKSLLSSFRGSGNSHIIETLLSTEGVTLELLLDSDSELIQELKSQNPSLISFFTASTTSHLLTYITQEPSTDDIRLGHKFPFIACEVFKSGATDLLNQFFTDQSLLDQLFAFLSGKKLNPTLAGYFSAVTETLLKHNSYELLSYIHETRDIGRVLIDHLESTSVMDLVFKLMACEDHGNPAYLDKLGEMIDYILQNFNENKSGPGFRMFVSNSARLLTQLLINHIESSNWTHVQQSLSDSPNAEIIVNCALSSNSVLANGALSVLDAYLSNLDVKVSDDNIVSEELPDLLLILIKKVEKISDILKNGNNVLGANRLALVRVLNKMVRLHFNEIREVFKDQMLIKDVIVSNKQELVPKFPWNSFLHNSVFDLLSYILLCDHNELRLSVILDSGLVPFLISCKDIPPKSVGYLGLVGSISNVLIKTSPNQLSCFDGWKNFVQLFLDPKNFQEKVVLGHGSLIVKPDIMLPDAGDADEEFFDAIEGPEDYQIPGTQLNQALDKIVQAESSRGQDLKGDSGKKEDSFKGEINENSLEVQGNLNEEEKEPECNQ